MNDHDGSAPEEGPAAWARHHREALAHQALRAQQQPTTSTDSERTDGVERGSEQS